MTTSLLIRLTRASALRPPRNLWRKFRGKMTSDSVTGRGLRHVEAAAPGEAECAGKRNQTRSSGAELA